MGIPKVDGHSATIDAFLVIDRKRVEVAKTNEQFVVLSESCQAPPGAEADLVVVIDDRVNSRRVRLLDGIVIGQQIVHYQAIT